MKSVMIARPRRSEAVLPLLALGLCAALLAPAGAKAQPAPDPKPPMSFQELLDCQLVVLGRYEGHDEQSLSLRVVNVLKGPGRSGGLLKVQLKHRYCIETGPVGPPLPGGRQPGQDEGAANLCYKFQMLGTGGPVPAKALDDLRQPAVYFFQQADEPSLARRGQVQPGLLAEGWRAALAGRPTSLIFRLAQPVSPSIRREALEELHRTRDARTLQQLLTWVAEPVPAFQAALPCRFSPEEVLAAVGDRNGEVYGPLLRLLQASQPQDARAALRIAPLLAQVSPRRAVRDLPALLERGPAALRKPLAESAGYLASDEGLNLIFRMLSGKDPLLFDGGIRALSHLLFSPLPPTGLDTRQTEQLKQRAFAQLKNLTAGDDLPAGAKENLRKAFASLLEEPKEPHPLLGKLLAPLPPRWDVTQIDYFMATPGVREWLKKGLAPAEWANQLSENLQPLLARPAGPPIRHLEYLFALDETKGKAALKTALENRRPYPLAIQCEVLALAVGHGRAELLDELLKTVRQAFDFERKGPGLPSSQRWLLVARNDKALAEYLRILDESKRLVWADAVADEQVDPLYGTMLQGLWPEQPGPYFQRAGELLESPALPVRRVGELALFHALYWNLDLRSWDFAAVRAEKLKTVLPELNNLAKMPEPQMRSHLLGLLGVELSGEPGKAWIGRLSQAALSFQTPIARNALRLIELVSGEYGCGMLTIFRRGQREAALKLFLSNRLLQP